MVQVLEGDDAQGQDVSPTDANQGVPLLAAIPQGVLTVHAPRGDVAGAWATWRLCLAFALTDWLERA